LVVRNVHRGGQFVRAIEDSLRQADVFLVLLSPAYLRSSWCRRERDIALSRENELGHQFIFVLEVTRTPGADLGFLQSYNRLDASGDLDVLAAALPLDTRAAPPGPLPGPTTWRKPVAIVACALAVVAIVAIAVVALRPSTTRAPDPALTTAPSIATASTPPPSPSARVEPTGNVLTVTPDKPGCSSSYLVTGAVRAAADRKATAVWLVNELYASASHNDPNNLYFAKLRLDVKADGTFEVRIPANSEAGVRDSRLLLVASPTPEADRDLAKSLSADQAKDGSYPDPLRTQLHLGNVEIATSPDFHQAC
jgi:TIR domain